MSGRNRHIGSSVLTKATSILDAFAGDRVEMSLADLARVTDLPPSTVHRLAAELVQWGGLERTEAGGYAVGIRLWEVAARSRRSYGLRDTAMPFLQGLYDLTRQHVQLAVVDGSDVLLIEKISAARAVETVGRAGGRLPLHASAVGRSLLAFSTAEFQTRILGGPLHGLTSSTTTSPALLRQQLAAIRRSGHAVVVDEVTAGVASCAAPILDASGSSVAAVSVVIPASKDSPAVWSNAVMTAAFGISRALTQQRISGPISAPAISRRLFH
ncbi:IclR family transcriptional regulator [Rhodococcus qingshengii]|uniref:IclR family transcriptional regulator n=1 Tax=Rhodococcus qingshengii TaxID=334542 RepID=UPI001BE95F82|nr:IclR family transcriptional regulator [Rhodococcus qingshengii]MBT2269956.1 IclR family transcriptional regulator [Rhodococcus qingshengii]